MSNVANRQWPHSQAPAGWPTTTNAAQPTTQPWPTVRMPTVPPAAAEILRDAVWHIDAAEHQASGANAKTVRNLGWGGAILNARCGSTTVADTNDPAFLPYDGTPYVYLPGLAGNSLTCTAPATATQCLATALNGTTASGAATGGVAFTFSTAGSWATVSLLDAGSAVVASFVGANLTTGSAATQTDAYGVAWTVNRATSGRKSVAVVAPVWLFGTDDYMKVMNHGLLDFRPGQSFTILIALRQHAAIPVMAPVLWKRFNVSLFPGYGITGGSGSPEPWSLQLSDGVTIAIAPIAAVTAPLSSLAVVSGTVDAFLQRARIYVNNVTGLPMSAAYAGKLDLSSGMDLHVGRNGSGSYYSDMEFMSAAIFRRDLSAPEIATLTAYYQGKYK